MIFHRASVHIPKRFILFFYTMMFSLLLQAQLPTEADIKAKVGGNVGGVKGFKLGKSGFTRISPQTGNEEWLREVIITRAYDVPEITSNQRGYAVYDIPGVAAYRFVRFLRTTQHLEGIPDPTLDDLKKMAAANPVDFFGPHYYQNMLRVEGELRYPEIPYQRWHTVRSVEIFVKIIFEQIISYTETETREQVISMRLYRDNVKGPWTRFYAQHVEHEENKILEVKKYSLAEMEQLKKKTLGLLK